MHGPGLLLQAVGRIEGERLRIEGAARNAFTRVADGRGPPALGGVGRGRKQWQTRSQSEERGVRRCAQPGARVSRGIPE